VGGNHLGVVLLLKRTDLLDGFEVIDAVIRESGGTGGRAVNFRRINGILRQDDRLAGKMHDQAEQIRRMAGQVDNLDALRQLHILIDQNVVCRRFTVGFYISAVRPGIGVLVHHDLGILVILLRNINIRMREQIKPAGVIQVHVGNDDCLHVLGFHSTEGKLVFQALFRLLVQRIDLLQILRPIAIHGFRIAASIVEDVSFLRLDQECHDRQLNPFILNVRIAIGADDAASYDVVLICLQIAGVQEPKLHSFFSFSIYKGLHGHTNVPLQLLISM
jgi:hypothetical protein